MWSSSVFATGPARLTKRSDVPEPIDRYRVQELVAAGAQLVEVLPEEEFAEEHLPGASNIHLKRLDAEVVAQLDPGRPIVVYCWDGL